jgi:hypothetical protein
MSAIIGLRYDFLANRQIQYWFLEFFNQIQSKSKHVWSINQKTDSEQGYY